MAATYLKLLCMCVCAVDCRSLISKNFADLCGPYCFARRRVVPQIRGIYQS